MNKSLAIIGLFVLIILGVAGAVIILIYRPESIGTLTAFVLTVIGLAVSGVVTFGAINEQGKKLETIQRQTNGNLSAKEEENKRLTNILIAAGIDPTGNHSAAADTVATSPLAKARE
jgi:uncharacterized membrane protein